MAAPLLAESASTVAPSSHSWLWDHAAHHAPPASDMARLTRSLDSVVEGDFTEAQEALGATDQELMLAALGRAVARVLGGGILTVDIDNGAAGFHRVGLVCDARRDLTGLELLGVAQRALATGAGLHPTADMSFSLGTSAPGPSVDTEHRLALQVQHDGEAVQLDWWYDSRSFERNTVRELAEQFPLALIEVTSG